MSCLNVDCQSYFSIEGCQNEKTIKSETPTTCNEIACPDCEYKMCLDCMGLSHGTGPCKNMDKYAEINKKVIEDLGAKPCPTCGAQIQKAGGCNHMICKSMIASLSFEYDLTLTCRPALWRELLLRLSGHLWPRHETWQGLRRRHAYRG